MEQAILNEILSKHRKWINKEDGGERADLRGTDLRDADLDYSCLPLWCGSLKMHVDNRLVIQLLYHLLSWVSYSKHVSNEIKKLLLTEDLVELANKFHRVDECGKIEVYKATDEATN